VRRPDLPPVVPTDAQLRVEYGDLTAIPPASASPAIIKPTAIQLSFSAPPAADATGRPPVAAAVYNVIFRREKVLPIGSYAQDAVVQGNRTDGLPTSNARRLPTDIKIQFDASDVKTSEEDKTRRFIAITADELRNAGVLPEDNSWEPQAWRIFVQT